MYTNVYFNYNFRGFLGNNNEAGATTSFNSKEIYKQETEYV